MRWDWLVLDWFLASWIFWWISEIINGTYFKCVKVRIVQIFDKITQIYNEQIFTLFPSSFIKTHLTDDKNIIQNGWYLMSPKTKRNEMVYQNIIHSYSPDFPCSGLSCLYEVIPVLKRKEIFHCLQIPQNTRKSGWLNNVSCS